MKIRYCLMLLLLTTSCTKVGSNEWAQLNYEHPSICGANGSANNAC